MEPFSPLSQQSLPIEVVQGQTFILPVTYVDSQGVAINLTGYTAKMQIRSTEEGTGTPLIELSTDNGLIVITPASGFVQCTIPAASSAIIPAGLAFYDLFITSVSTGVAERLLFGEVKITQRVTK